MHNPKIHGSGFIVFLGKIGFGDFRKGRISSLISLYNVSRALVYNNDMIVFKQHLKVLWGAVCRFFICFGMSMCDVMCV